MGPSNLWLPISFLVVTILLLRNYADAQIATTMRHFCSGSSNGRSVVSRINRYQELQGIYENCTRVYGNVEITHLNASDIENKTLHFLDDIEEVKGYVLIYNTDIKRISFKKLKIIWGDDLLQDAAAMQFEMNHNLRYVSMPSLRSIKNGKIHTLDSNKVCHLHQTVDTNEILDFDPSRLVNTDPSAANAKYCAKKSITCHPSCNGHCWGPEAGDCQSVYRSNCPDDCASKQCFWNTTTKAHTCCHDECIAGCTGKSNKECIACSRFMQCKEGGADCTCVDQCTRRMIYNMKSRQLEPNPDGYFSVDNRHCEKVCPVNRLVHDDTCVEHCGAGYHYDPNKGDRTCRSCNGPCPKICKFEKKVNSINIHELQNCTEIEGFIQIDISTYKMRNDNGTVIPPITREQLDILKTVRFISEYLYVAVADANLKSLSFLENLEYIEGRSLYSGRQALIVSKNDNLVNLGLRKLKKIDKGDVIISNNIELCFIDSFVWKESIINKNSTVTLPNNRIKEACEKENLVCHSTCDPAFGCWGPSPADCRKCRDWIEEGNCVPKCTSIGFFEDHARKVCEPCYSECDTCTGPGMFDCLTCRAFKLYTKHGNTMTDYGDIDDEAPAKNVSHLVERATVADHSLYPQLTCVRFCPMRVGDKASRFYEEDGTCKRCDKSCYNNGCTGPLNTPGPNGCVQCKYALLTQDSNATTVDRCLYNEMRNSTNQVCETNGLTDYYVQTAANNKYVSDFLCLPCDDECHTCTSKGASRKTNECTCKNMVAIVPYHKTSGGVVSWSEEQRCVSDCLTPRGPYMLYFDNTTTDKDAPGGVCRTCSSLCERNLNGGPTCRGGTDRDCIKCARSERHQNVYTYNITKDEMICTKNCTALAEQLGLEKLYSYDREMICSVNDLETRDKINRAAIYSLAALFLIVVIIIAFMLYRRQKRLSKELEQEKVANNPEMPELIPMDFNGPVTINREKFHLISGHELSRSNKQLGSGAFGVVYAGCWMPPYQKKTGKPMKVPVAIKVVRDPSGRAQSEMLDEALKMTMLKHENLLRIVGVCLSGDDLQLVTLLRPLGNLREFLQKHKGSLSGKELLAYSYQIASGMKYLTDHRVVHRDLAARNVLVKNIQHVEITDFGLAKLIDIGSDSVQVGEGKVAIKWLALEALEKQVYNTATDVWAFGVTVWEILTYGESPYANMTPMGIKDFLLCGQRLAQPNNCSTELYKILIDCWLPNPDSRPTFAMIKDILYRYCRAPYVFVIDPDVNSAIEMDNCSQRGLIEEILDDTDFEDPQNYFDSEPNTPGCANLGDVFNPIGVRRMDSLGSQRYAQDPTSKKEFGMADDNYLVPNSHAAEMGATMYTPVVVDESGNSSLVESDGYYNEVKPGAEYINDTQAMTKKSNRNSRDDRLSMIEEDDGVMEKESCL